MREIKFRAWSEKCGDMYPIPTIFDAEPYKNFEDLILMQFTGLKDKNGKEIYEGDIVKWAGVSWKISWKWISWQMENENKDEMDWFEESEVIGNIYENSDLNGELKKEAVGKQPDALDN